MYSIGNAIRRTRNNSNSFLPRRMCLNWANQATPMMTADGIEIKIDKHFNQKKKAAAPRGGACVCLWCWGRKEREWRGIFFFVLYVRMFPLVSSARMSLSILRLYTTAAAAAVTPIKYRPVAGIIVKRNAIKAAGVAEENMHSLDRKPHEPVYLLVRKPRKHHAWQFPQGGIEPGERVSEAALREMREECGDALEARLLSTRPCGVYRYPFPPSFGKKRRWAYTGAQ
ncbi:hypothetical protein BX666DRAFT_1924704, partial [Dichotomocladium elegans]